MMKVNISETNKGVKPRKEFLSKILDNAKPSRLGKPCSELKNCDVNSVLETLKRFDQKYCLKPVKEQNVIPVRNDILLPTSHTNNRSSSSNINSSVKFSGKDCRFSSSPDIIPPNSSKGISNKESFDMLGNPLTKINSSSHIDTHLNSNDCFIQQEADHSLQTYYKK
jgi:hypothetical protein